MSLFSLYRYRRFQSTTSRSTCNVSAKFYLSMLLTLKVDLLLVKRHLAPNHINQREFQHGVINKANKPISFKFHGVHFLLFWTFLVQQLYLILFWRHMLILKLAFTLRVVRSPQQRAGHKNASGWRFYVKKCSHSLLKAENNAIVGLLKNGMTTNHAAFKLKPFKPSHIWIENCDYLKIRWQQEQIKRFRDPLRWYNRKMRF